MAKMNYYTQNGWAGSNYDSKLQTKDVAKKVREFAKKNFPAFKFSVTSRWSMYTDSLYIVLKSGPCAPFVEGSKLAKRGHFETMSSVKSWEKDGLTPEVFAALDGVTSYASSFRYDDSDGMQDYFDTNFFLKIEIDYDYTVIEPKAKKAKEPKQEEAKAETVEAASVEGLEIVDYSEKAIAVFGETKEIKEQLKEFGGKFNPSLRYGEGKRAGWIFSKKQADKVRALLAPSSKADELYLECKEEFSEMINNSLYNVRMIQESADEAESELTVNILVDGNKTNLYLYSYSGAHINDYLTGVYYYVDGLTYDEAYNLAEKFNEYRGKRVCSDGSDELRINFVSIDEAVLFEEWLKNKEKGSIIFKQTDELNRVYYYDVEGADIITIAKLRADIQPGDVFNVYTDKERKYGVQYDGISPESSLYKALPGIIATNEKLEAQTFSISTKELPANVELYEKKITGKRYIVNDKPDKFGCFHVIDTLDNAACDFYQAKEDAERRAEYLNELTDGNGRIKKAV